MLIKLTKAEVAEACEYWLRAKKYSINESDKRVETSGHTLVGVDYRLDISCKHTRGGVECLVVKLHEPPSKAND